MITVKIGNLFESPTLTWVNTVNCVGVMGKGVAAEFKKRFPAMFEDYVARCEAGQVEPGRPYPFRDLFGTPVVNFPTKNHWRSPSRLQDIAEGLDYFVAHYSEWGIESIAFPPLGTGNGGLDWRDVGPLMYQKLKDLPIPVEIYAPYGTSSTQLTPQFLDQPVNASLAKQGVRHAKLRDEWLALLEVVYQLSQQPYARPVGRIIFQKISYVMTELGVDTGFQFEQGSYGPFSEEIQKALTVMANENLIREEQLGQMTSLVTSAEYEDKRKDFGPRLAPYQKRIAKTVDLFSRIKSTAQAEEVTTVLFAVRKLKQDQGEVSEQEVLDFISAWKKSMRSQEKQETLSTAIRNLQMLGWLKLTYSESLPFPAY